MKKTFAVTLLTWWFMFYWDGWLWRPYGPFIQRDTCERTAWSLGAAGFSTRCVEFYY